MAVTYAGHWAVRKAVAAIERVTGADKDNPGRESLREPVTATKGIEATAVAHGRS